MGKKGYSHEFSAHSATIQKNISERPGFADNPQEGYYGKFSPDLETTTISGEEAVTMETDVKHMHKALGARTEKEYSKEKMRDNLDTNLRTLFENKDFHKALSPIANQTNPDAIEKLLKEYSEKPGFEALKDLTDKETTYAVSFLMTEWFTTAYKGKEDEKLSEKDLIKKNKELKNRIELVRKYTRDKYIEEFKKVIPKMSPALETQNAETLVNEFMKGIYDELLKELSREKTPPPIFDFRTLKVTDIPSGSEFFSGTRIIQDGKTVKTLSHTVAYETVEKEEGLVHEYGFLEGYGKEYKLNGTGMDRDIARVLLEIARPIPAENTDLLKTRTAIEILALGAYRLIAGKTKEEATKNYRTLIELVEDPSKYNEKNPDHKAALDRLREVVVQIRKDQHNGKASEFKTTTGHIVKIDMVNGTTFNSGAFSKCTNPSFYVTSGGKAEVETPESGVVGTSQSIQQTTNAETTIASVTFSLAMGFTGSKTEKPKVEEKPKEPKPAPNSSGGVSTEAPGVSSDASREGQIPAPPQATTNGSGGQGLE